MSMCSAGWQNKIQKQRLFSKEPSEKYEGRHGMIFTGINEQKYLSVHSPNSRSENGRKEQPIFMPVAEKNDTLVCLRLFLRKRTELFFSAAAAFPATLKPRRKCL